MPHTRVCHGLRCQLLSSQDVLGRGCIDGLAQGLLTGRGGYDGAATLDFPTTPFPGIFPGHLQLTTDRGTSSGAVARAGIAEQFAELEPPGRRGLCRHVAG